MVKKIKKAQITEIIGQDKSYLAEFLRIITGYISLIVSDQSRSKGTPGKLMDITKLKKLGCNIKANLEIVLRRALSVYFKNNSKLSSL